jgi:hypothetical protein
MQIVEQLQAGRMSSELEPGAGARADGSSRLSRNSERSRRERRGAMSRLVTVMIESLAASAQAVYPVCPAPDQTREEDAQPASQAFRQAELGAIRLAHIRGNRRPLTTYSQWKRSRSPPWGGAHGSDHASSVFGQPFAERGKCGERLPNWRHSTIAC